MSWYTQLNNNNNYNNNNNKINNNNNNNNNDNYTSGIKNNKLLAVSVPTAKATINMIKVLKIAWFISGITSSPPREDKLMTVTKTKLYPQAKTRQRQSIFSKIKVNMQIC